MTLNTFKLFSLLILFFLGACNLLTADPIDQASEIVKNNLNLQVVLRKIMVKYCGKEKILKACLLML